MNDIKLTMLGTSGSGKTCFMLGMYNRMEAGVEGFTFSTPDKDQGLELNDMFDKLCEERGDGRWPKGNVQTKRYHFHFNCGFEKLLGFSWMDYRGGALQDVSSAEDVRELEEHLHESFGVFVCVPGDLLAANKNISDFKIQREAKINRINQFLAAERHNREQQQLPLPIVCILITKYDFCLGGIREEDVEAKARVREQVCERIQVIFSPLFDRQNGFRVCIVPVTLGPELFLDEQAKDIDPINVHFPVAFMVRKVYDQYLSVLREKSIDAERDRERLQEAQRKKAGTFLGKMFGSSAETDIQIATAEETRRSIEQLISAMQSRIERLSLALRQECPEYLNGERI